MNNVLMLKKAAVQTRLRLRIDLGLRTIAQWFPMSVLFLTPIAVLYRLQLVSGPSFGVVSALTAVCMVMLVARAVSRGPGLVGAALLLDRTHHLSGQLAAALDFSGDLGKSLTGVPSKRREPGTPEGGFEGLVLEQTGHLGAVSPQSAVPLSVPEGTVWSVLMAVLFVILVTVPFSHPQAQFEHTTQDSDPAPQTWVNEDDAELLRQKSQKLANEVESQEGQEAAARFNEIVMRVVSGEIDRREAFQLAAELSADLKDAAFESELLQAGLSERGKTLANRTITKELGKALEQGRDADAEEALKKLAERLREGTDPLSKEELEELRQAIEEMRKKAETPAKKDQNSNEEAARQRSLEKRTQELRDKQKSGKASKSELSELKRKERELKRLDRKKKRKESSAQEALSELDRELAKAAQELQKERKKAGQFMDRARQKLARANQRKLSDQEKKELLKQIRELKERLRRQNKDGKASERLRKFQKRARGQAKPSGTSQSGEKREGGQKRGSGKVQLGPGGQTIPGQGQDSAGQAGGEEAGAKAGHAHDPNLLGDESRLKGAGTQDASAVAQDGGEGPSASETIVTAAEEGFSSASYERLFHEYRTVAEEVMERETVPPGRKSHVRRYFELIRPREGARRPKEESK